MRTINGIDLILVAIIIFGAAGCWMSHRPHGYCDYCDGPIRSDGIDGRGGWYCSVGCRVCGDGMQSRGRSIPAGTVPVGEWRRTCG